jgi:hypothetical protein
MLLKAIARAVVKHVGNIALLGVGGDLVLDVWKYWSESNQGQQQDPEKGLAAEVESLKDAKAAKEQAEDAVEEAASDKPEAVQMAVRGYLSEVLTNIRRVEGRRGEGPGPEAVRTILPPRTEVETIWNGVTREEDVAPELLGVRQQLAEAAYRYDWPRVFSILSEHREFVNFARPRPTGEAPSFYAPLHQAANGGAKVDEVQRLLGMGAWRTLQNARGERPVDVAAKRGHQHLLSILEPQYKQKVPLGVLGKIQGHFHAVIRKRTGRFVEEHALRLPELEPLLEMGRPALWFPLPGGGGFRFWLEKPGVEAKLCSEHWTRDARDPGQRHEITSAGAKQV